jgi:hypothetical protein
LPSLLAEPMLCTMALIELEAEPAATAEQGRQR